MSVWGRGIPVLAILLLVAGCGGGGGGGGGADGEDLPKQATVVAGDERVVHPLAPGRYRLSVREDCETWAVAITDEGGNLVYEKANAPIKILFINDLPGGNYFIDQTDASCTDWELKVVWVSSGG